MRQILSSITRPIVSDYLTTDSLGIKRSVKVSPLHPYRTFTDDFIIRGAEEDGGGALGLDCKTVRHCSFSKRCCLNPIHLEDRVSTGEKNVFFNETEPDSETQSSIAIKP
jgi:hypothetical protein